ncbi:MAG TPA: energy transducer TonB [Thermoanaerobaculia bacterium]|nr:energy transducer TonB [Thermoanaerobaculia bacterium]
MFETVAPETFAPRSRKVFYESLPVSIALHAAAAAAVLVVSTWQVTFPAHSPKMFAMYSLEEVPTPPPPPPPPAPPQKQVPVQQQQTTVVRTEEVAPTIIPDFIPTVMPETTEPVEVVEGVIGGVEGGIEGGVAGGSIDGVFGGEVGGEVGGTVGSVALPDTVVVKRDMPLPTAPMSMVFPKYPEEARLRGWEDILVVRYVIGKDGRVKEVTVLSHPDREVFEKTSVKAIRNWRFRPHKVDGVAQEIVHELTIFFKLEA